MRVFLKRIFNIYYNIGKRTPFLVKRCELGLARSSSEARRIDPNQDRTFLVETVKLRGKYKVEGNDIIWLCRTAFNDAHNYHDANYSTFHKLKNFRQISTTDEG